MKLLLNSDMHLMDTNPVSRIDDIAETQLNKVKETMDIYDKYNCDAWLQAGDMFDKSVPSLTLLSRYIKLFKEAKVKLYCVAGQHDLYMHNLKNLDKSPLRVLEAAGVLKILGKDIMLLSIRKDKRKNKIYSLGIEGSSYGEKISRPEKLDKTKYITQILVIHKLITPKIMFPGQKLITPRRFIKNNPGWDLILCGDCHCHFFDEYRGTTILNTGCMTRRSINVIDLALKPCVYVWDTVKDEFERIFLKIKPVKEVLNVRQGKKSDNKISSEMEEFIETFKQSKGLKISFQDTLNNYLKTNKVNKKVEKYLLRRWNENKN